MEKDIYVLKRGQKTGPFSLVQLKEKLSQGEIGIYDTASQGGQTRLIKQFLENETPIATGSAIEQPEIQKEGRGVKLVSRQQRSKAQSDSEDDAELTDLPPPSTQATQVHHDRREAATTTFGPTGLATPGSRLAAVILDQMLFLLVLIPIGLGVFLSMNPQEIQRSQEIGGSLFLVGCIFCICLLIVQCVFLASKGQTLGKKMMGIRIVNLENLKNPGFGRLILLRYFVNLLLTLIPWVGWIYSLVDSLFIFRGDRRCIHDLMASTIVVEERYGNGA